MKRRTNKESSKKFRKLKRNYKERAERKMKAGEREVEKKWRTKQREAAKK